MTVSQAAAVEGVSEKTLRKRITSGKVTAKRVELDAGGWAWRVAPDSLEGSNRFQPVRTDRREVVKEDVLTEVTAVNGQQSPLRV